MSGPTAQPLGWTGERLLALLPANWRVRDAAAPGGGGALAGLLAVLAEVADALELDLDELHDDWFIETCADWAVPYIGELVGASPMHDAGGLVDLRAWVADTIALRRRKGTLAAVEAVARAVTAYPTVAVETRRLLGWHQHLAHVRATRSAFVAISGERLAEAGGSGVLDHVDGAFDIAPRFVDVRSIRTQERRGPAGTDGAGHHNLPTVNLHAWEVATRRLEQVTLRPVADPPDGRYHVHPLALDLPLRRFARPEVDVEHLAGEEDLPSVLRRRWLHDVLNARRTAAAGGDPAPDDVFAQDPPLVVRWRAAPGAPLADIPPERIVACHLEDPSAPLPTGWRRPPATIDTTPAAGGAAVALPIDIGVDPATGRVAFPDGVAVDHVEIDLADAHVAVIGGGAPARDDDLAARLAGRSVVWQVAVSLHDPPGPTTFATLADAVAAWHAQPDGTVGMIVIVDSHRHPGGLTGAARMRVGPNSRLLVVGARWPALPVPGGLPGETARRLGVVDASRVRPVVVGDLDVAGVAGAPDDLPGELVLHGLWVDGLVRVVAAGGGDLGRLEVAHATVLGGVRVTSANARLELELTRAVSGPVEAASAVRSVTATDTVLHAPGGSALGAPTSAVSLERVTALGRVRAEELFASDCLLVGAVTVARRQAGCVRHSWVAPGSTTPRRYRCQPDLSLGPLQETGAGAAVLAATVARLQPSFVSEVPGHPALGLLLAGTPDALRRASSSAGEPGAHAHLFRPQREDNLRRALDEHLPLGLEAGLVDPGRQLP